MHISWARLASFCHLGFSDPLIVSKIHNKTHDPKGQENKIYTIVKGRETFYRRHKVPTGNLQTSTLVNSEIITANREDSDQTASEEAVWSGSALFVQVCLACN